MKTTLSTTLALVAACIAFGACDSVPIDDTRTDNRLFPARGVIRGQLGYQGPHPCSENGHIVGSAVLLFFARSNPPPPRGTASTPVNFGVVPGDTLFANEPRVAGARYCPKDHGYTDTIRRAAPFAVSPFDAGEYIVVSFFDYTGDFLPTFMFRNLPEAGDIAGGYLDTTDAAAHAGDPNYVPTFLPVTVGVPSAPAEAGGTPSLVIPAEGFVADNVPVTIGAVLPLARPYFYPDGADLPATNPAPTGANPNADPAFVPSVTMPQDIHVLAPSLAGIAKFEASFPHVKLNARVPAAEAGSAVDPTKPFHFQLSPDPKSLFIWSTGQLIPEGNMVPALYPLAVFSKLVDDPTHTADPQSILAQSSAGGPIVIALGITLGAGDNLVATVLAPQPTAPGLNAAVDHVTAMIRPSVLCIDLTDPAGGASLVTPFLTGPSSDPTIQGDQPLFDPVGVGAALSQQFGLPVTVRQGCLPTGRYAMNLVYPTGQAWTVPNETGSCAVTEGTVDVSTTPPSCSVHPPGPVARDVLLSQGTRAVLEITPSLGSPTCAAFPVPPQCGGH